jgi:cell division septation protein DedD
MADDESRGVHLSDKQLVFVFMAATVIAVVVFLFGVLVGRGVQQARGPIADDGMTAAVDVVPDGTAEETPAAGGATKPGSGGAGTDDLTYPERLGRTPPEERLKPVSPPVGGRLTDTAPPDVPGEAVAPAPTAAAPRDPAPPPAPAAELYKVQVAAVKSRDEADGIVKHLATKGYDAYVVLPQSGTSLGMFRVRIGAFKDKRQADLLAERLLREEKRYKPWVTR